MGGKSSVAAGKGVAPMERSKEKGGSSAEYKKTTTIALSKSSPESTQSLPPLPPQNSLPEGLPTDIQLAQEKDNYTLLNEEENCIHLEEINFYKQCIENKNNELLHLQRQLHKLEWHRREASEKVQQYQEKCRDLCLKLERAEYLYSQQSMADTGSYQDSAATPPLLQVAADSVKDAITVCASELLSRIKKNSLSINLALLNLDSKEAGQIIKFALQGFLCHFLFAGFEDPFLFGLPPFEKPAKRKTHFLQVYKRCRDLDATKMFDEESDFARYFGVKEFNLCMYLKEQLLRTDDVQKKEDFITLELCSRNSNYYTKLLRLVKAVWVLQKLAFAFEPSAEIFRVGQGSVLDEEFMEDVAGDDDEDEDEDEDDKEDEKMAGSFKSVKQVRFMCVPGFTVRHTIIKSRVCSLKESQHCLINDASPMTVD